MATSDPHDTPTGTERPPDVPADAAPTRQVGLIRLLGIAVIVAGAILAVSGVITWIVVQTQLADEQITVSDDADRFAGEPVDGPLTAYAEADAIEGHALEASGGLTYAELPRDDPDSRDRDDRLVPAGVAVHVRGVVRRGGDGDGTRGRPHPHRRRPLAAGAPTGGNARAADGHSLTGP